MRKTICDKCGGNLVIEGDVLKCEDCGADYEAQPQNLGNNSQGGTPPNKSTAKQPRAALTAALYAIGLILSIAALCCSALFVTLNETLRISLIVLNSFALAAVVASFVAQILLKRGANAKAEIKTVFGLYLPAFLCVLTLALSVPTAVYSYLSNQTLVMVDGVRYYYSMTDGGIIITDAVTNKDVTEITVPEKLADKPVVTIGNNAFSNTAAVTSITLPDSVTKIEAAAFSECAALESVTLPENLTTLGERAFISCSSLAEIILPNGIITIEPQTFDGCASLSGVVFPSSLISIEIGAFANCYSLESASIPNNVSRIALGAFQNCTKINSVTVPFVGATIDGSISTHFGYIFGARTHSENSAAVPKSLETVTVTGGATVYDNAFLNCLNIRAVNLPVTVKSIGASAFRGCQSLAEFTVPRDVTTIGEYAFSGCSALSEASLPVGLTAVSDYMFYGSSALSGITVPNNVTSVGMAAFSGCVSLKDVVISNSVQKISNHAFSGCNSIESITLPFVGATSENSENSFFGYIFGASSYNENATYVPKSLKSVTVTNAAAIADFAFANCQGITRVTVSDVTTAIGVSAFNGCGSLEEITLPFVGATIDGSISTYFGYIFGADSYSTQARYIPSSLKKITVTNATSIASRAFYNCASVETFDISNTVESIGLAAFSRCNSVKTLTLPFVGETKLGSLNTHFGYIFGAASAISHTAAIPSSLTTVNITDAETLGEYAFYNCVYLKVIDLPRELTALGRNAFSGCSSLLSVTVPEGVTTIAEYAFSGCSTLERVIIASSVTTVAASAFEGCNVLQTVYFKGTAEEWTAIDINSEQNDALTDAARYYYSEEENTDGKHWHYVDGEPVVWN